VLPTKEASELLLDLHVLAPHGHARMRVAASAENPQRITPNPTMSIRTAIASDATAIARIHVASWRAAYRGLLPDKVLDDLDDTQRRAQWAANIASSSTDTIVHNSKHGIVGFASFGSTRDKDDHPTRVGEIQAIYVDPDEWSKGIGQSLCKRVSAELSALSYEQITLWVLKGNQRACRFYQLAGFILDGKTKIETIGVPLEAIRYRMQTTRIVIP